jgi:hypothetical protein
MGGTQRRVGRLRVAQCTAWTRPPRVTVSQYCCWKMVAILPYDKPSCLLRMTANATACGPSCAAAAPSASDVWSACRPWTRRQHPRHPSDGDLKGTDHDPDRQLFLVLRRHTGLDDAIAATGTARPQRRLMRFIDARWHAPTGLGTIGVARLAPRAFRILLQRFRKWRRLSIARPAGLIELSLQMVDLLTQSLSRRSISRSRYARSARSRSTSGSCDWRSSSRGIRDSGTRRLCQNRGCCTRSANQLPTVYAIKR